VQQEEKIKTAGLETGVPLEKMPAGCRRSDKRGRHGTPPFLVASGDVQQDEKIKTAGLDASDPIRGDAMERHHSWWQRETCSRMKR
jgi:hypothetical protein